MSLFFYRLHNIFALVHTCDQIGNIELNRVVLDLIWLRLFLALHCVLDIASNSRDRLGYVLIFQHCLQDFIFLLFLAVHATNSVLLTHLLDFRQL